MASHTSDDDEDYGDDPIKLFESSEEAVYFGSKAHENSTTTIDFSWKSDNTPIDPECGSPMEPSSGGNRDVLRPLSVKLVDCGQFPWYYRKYTQQILDLTGIELDSDSEVDVERLDNSDENDCIIVEGLKKKCNNETNVINSIESVLTTMRLASREKRKNTLRLKEEFEIQRALSLKNTTKVDFKLNQGLVGMKVKNLPVTINIKTNKKCKKPVLKQDDKTVGDVYVHAVDKVLHNIGTELIPIIEKESDKGQGDQQSSSVTHTIEGSKKTAIKGATYSTKAYSKSHKNINKICEQLLDCVKTNKNPEVLNKNVEQIAAEANVTPTTEPTKEISKLETVPIAVPSDKSPKTVKDVTKTNKFKNDQLKNQSKLLELLSAKPNENKTEVSNKNGQFQLEGAANETHKNHDNEPKCEPNSPILPSSNLSIKSKSKRGIHPKSSNSVCSASQGSNNLNKNKLSFTELIIAESDKLTDVSKNADEINKSGRSTKLKSKESFLLKDFDIRPNFTKVSEKHVKNSNEGTGINLNTSTSNDKAAIKDGHKDSVAVIKKNKSVERRRKEIRAIQKEEIGDNLRTKNHKDPKDLSGIASSGSSSLFNGTKKHNFNGLNTNLATLGIPCHYYKPTHTSIANPKSQNSVPNVQENLKNPNRGLERNSFSTTSNQKSNIQTVTPKIGRTPILLQVENYQKTNIIRKPEHITITPVNLEPRCPYYPKTRFQFNSELPFRYSQYVPNPEGNPHFPLRNKTMQNYFPYFKSSVYPVRDRTQCHHLNNDWQSQNTVPLVSSLTPHLVLQKSSLHGNPGPQSFDSPIHSTVQPQNVPGSIFPTHANYVKTNNIPVICNDKDNLKNTNINLVPNKDDANKHKHKLEEMRKRTEPQSVNAEVVATKTEMLKELDNLSFHDNMSVLKRKHPDDASEIKRTSGIESTDDLNKKTKTNEAQTPKITNRQNSRIELQSKYSPPILPIPRYDKVLEHIASDPRIKIDKSDIATAKIPKQKSTIEIKPVQNSKRCRKRISHEFKEPSCTRRRYDGKKISLEEYKQRVYVKSASELTKRRVGKDNDKKYKHGPGPKIYKNQNAESDLGYDSDSTVLL